MGFLVMFFFFEGFVDGWRIQFALHPIGFTMLLFSCFKGACFNSCRLFGALFCHDFSFFLVVCSWRFSPSFFLLLLLQSNWLQIAINSSQQFLFSLSLCQRSLLHACTIVFCFCHDWWLLVVIVTCCQHWPVLVEQQEETEVPDDRTINNLSIHYIDKTYTRSTSKRLFSIHHAHSYNCIHIFENKNILYLIFVFIVR